MQTQPVTHGSVPNNFIHKHTASILGVLSGFDRLRLRGTLRELYCPQVMEAYLNACRILIKDFGQLVGRTTLALKEKARALAAQAGGLSSLFLPARPVKRNWSAAWPPKTRSPKV
jgi:hypothetical protein